MAPPPPAPSPAASPTKTTPAATSPAETPAKPVPKYPVTYEELKAAQQADDHQKPIATPKERVLFQSTDESLTSILNVIHNQLKSKKKH